MKRLESVDALGLWREQLSAGESSETVIRVCSTGCRALGALKVCDALEREIADRGLGESVRVVRAGCHGLCAGAVAVLIDPKGIFYQGVTADDAGEIIEKTVLGGETIGRLCWSAKKQTAELRDEIPFYRHQTRLVLRNCGVLDPQSLEDAVANGAYSSAAGALAGKSPDEVIAEVLASGLRGRGGAGFPTGRKWQFARAAAGDVKYVVCNADEGDPGAFMDRSLLEGTPHAIVEGMVIAAYAIGATNGIVYVRSEYPLAVRNTNTAIGQAREAGLLGERILGTDYSFDIEVREGAGAFVCGEESALIASLEGYRGMPRPRPPFPAQRGYLGKPTIINNVETLANVPLIITHGVEWYQAMGTDGSKGTKVFALAGKVNNTGLVEVPMGATLREIVFDIGGGIPDGRRFKAAQMGGPSGGCVPAEHLDMPIDYDSVQSIGAIMGSGGLIVMDDSTCMVDIARYFMEFVQSESCGKCTPCRIGTQRMLEILQRICDGKSKPGDLKELESLAQTTKTTSLCGLGQTGPNPVLSTLRHFREEYRAHVEDGTCPAGVCNALLTFTIDPEVCLACGVCQKACPAEAITGQKKVPHEVIQARCIHCGSCFSVCPTDAVKKQ